MIESPTESEFYIGWQSEAPPRLARFVRGRVLGLLVLTATVGAGWTAAQAPFAASRFEFGVVRTFEGRLEHVPYPTLVVERPGAASESRWLLTVFGKHGADAATRPFDGHRVRCAGSLIHRDGTTMVELLPESIVDLGVVAPGSSPSRPAPLLAEDVVLEGEIVDSKCFLGVMKPGNLKPHRACAARCISGGVPPVLLVRDAEGHATYHLLVDETGGAVNHRVLHLVAEPVRIRGRRTTHDGLSILRADPATYERL